MTRLAVFDLDGTLIDSRRAIADAVRVAWQTLDLEPPSYDQTRRIVGLSLTEAWRVLAPEFPVARYGELDDAYKSAFLSNRAAGMEEPLYDGARETLAALKRDGWLLGVATGKSRRGIEHIFAHHGIGELFSAAFCADDGPSKPDPHMLRCNMRALDARPEHTVMIGDTSFDMAMARAADAYALGVSWGFHTVEEIREGGAHEIVDAFAALDQSLATRRA